MSIISDAARIIRAGEEYSQSNKKLREAVKDFIIWFHCVVRPGDLPEETCWQISTYGGDHVEMAFKVDTDDWRRIHTANTSNCPMEWIYAFCTALTDARGRKLLTWLEEHGRINEQWRAELSQIKGKVV
ncbi:TPA: hypothetical protein DEB72_01570 [Patescibacteria group bacterium]|nr:hypothetical protein [Patescibacteria group bacterium]